MARRQYSFQKGSKGGDKSHSITLKDRGPANADGDTRNRTKSVTVRCDGTRAQGSICKRAKQLEADAIALASKEYVADEERTDKPKKRKPEPPPF